MHSDVLAPYFERVTIKALPGVSAVLGKSSFAFGLLLAATSFQAQADDKPPPPSFDIISPGPIPHGVAALTGTFTAMTLDPASFAAPLDSHDRMLVRQISANCTLAPVPGKAHSGNLAIELTVVPPIETLNYQGAIVPLQSVDWSSQSAEPTYGSAPVYIPIFPISGANRLRFLSSSFAGGTCSMTFFGDVLSN